ncbi:MAG: murein biosynthesis integral membrane protein MurJ [Magnetococcales bacterium]|nr:murein biosynthesis integral membrane protein MurJ [Magnetococcales bacterium]
MNDTSPTSTKKNGLIRAVGTISFFTLLSRVLGFVRDIVIARGFGTGMGADAFFVALKLPNFLRRLFAEGAFSTAFVPVFSDYLTQGDPNETRKVAKAVFTLLLSALLLVTALAQLAMPFLILVIAPGFADQPDKVQLTVELTRITFPYILFISLTALAGGILNSHRKFAIPAATPMLLNITLIGGATLISPHLETPAIGLAIGVFLGGAAQLALQIPALKQIGVPFGWRWQPHHEAVKRILKLMGPSILGVSVAQINLLFDLFLASFLPEGSISYLYYADRLVEFPLGLIGIAMGTAILPALSAKASQGDMHGLRHDLDFALRLMLVINLPAAVGLIVLGDPILSLLFERGAFDINATRLTAQALTAYATGLLAFSAIKVLAPAFYAMKDTKTPVRIAIICLISNMVLNVILMIPLKHAGLALATSLAAFLNAGLLYRALKGRIDFSLGTEVWHTTLKTAGASLVMAVFLLSCKELYWQPGMADLTKTIILLPIIGGGIGMFLAVGYVLHIRELRDLVTALQRRKKSS